ncbi:MAG: hypothetical protein KC766_11845 [Myxococcales bacterium]|nr:hypothetical protein [Myxococcales bacterium]
MRLITAKRALSLLAILAAVPACRGGGTDDSGGSGGSGGGGNVSGLQCPNPGTLPFSTESSSFENADSADTESLERVKDSASDILGNPGGKYAYTTMPVEDAPLDAPYVFEGQKARTVVTTGLSFTGFSEEYVSFWVEDGSSWKNLGRQKTDTDGNYSFSLSDFVGGQPPRIGYAILEGDGSCTAHYSFLLERGANVIVTDIDGTLTSSDEELTKQIGDGNYDPQENQSASVMMNRWAKKGYQVVYLTARPHFFRAETRAWMIEHGFPEGPMITANQLVFGDSARTYKRTWVNRIADSFGWTVTAAYGNAGSDIDAYEDAGIPKDITFIIGENAGQSGTVAIQGNDYTAHITEFVDAQPDAN